jgi:hypothetical protein
MDIEIIGKAVASAISQTLKFRESEQKVALGLIGKASKPEDIVDNMSYIGNVSAIRQKLEKAGLLPTSPAELDAFQRQVKAALDAIKAKKG